MGNRTTGDRDELSHRLRELRRAAGLSGPAVAKRLGTTQSRVSRTENGVVLADPEFVGQLCQMYGASAAESRALVAMAKDVKGGFRRLVVRKDRRATQARIRRITEQSRLIRTFAPSAVPGELQTFAYVRSIFGDDGGAKERLRLQQELLDDPGRRFVFVIPEIALGWAPVPSTMMVEQVEHIAEMTHRASLRIGIIPWGCNTNGRLSLHSWHLYDRRFVIIGFTHGAWDLDQPADVQPYIDRTDELEHLAVWEDDARVILAGVADRYRAL